MHPESNSFVLLMITLDALVSFGSVFIICELCQRITNAFEEIEDVITQFKWYIFPDEVKRMLSIIINTGQQSVELKCFGSTSCNRETFKKVSFQKSFLIIITNNVNRQTLFRILKTLEG